MSTTPIAVAGSGKTERTPLGINDLVDMLCHEGGELVIRHGHHEWDGSPPDNFLPAIESLVTPLCRALRRKEVLPRRSTVVLTHGFIRGGTVWHVIALPTGMPACGWLPAQTSNTLYAAIPASARESRQVRVCLRCDRTMKRAAWR